MYIRSNIIYENIIQETNQRTGVDFLACKVKIGKEWIMIIGAYKPPSSKQDVWKLELQNLFEVAKTITNNAIILGDFNCDLLVQPHKSSNDGRILIDLIGGFHLVNLDPVHTGPDPYGHHIKLKSLKMSMTLKFVS